MLMIVVVIVTAVAFDFTNGFHDTANAMATSIATGALRPKVAVGIAAVLNLVGAFVSVKVAATISSGILDDNLVKPSLVFAGLIGAILWNLVTWLAGLPSSSSHALFGGLIGATLVGVGTKGVHGDIVISKIIVPAVASPLVAGVIALAGTYLAYRLTKKARDNVRTRGFRTGQIVSASLVSLAHGTNDAQKTMGVITLTLIAGGKVSAGSNPPWWVILLSGTAIGLGTYLGGWRIIRTMGNRITDVETPQGFAAESSSTAVILASSHLGFALSTTHVVSGSVIGSGVGRRLAGVHWGVAGQMAVAWVLTLPAAAAVGAVVALVAERGNFGVFLMALVAIAAGTAVWAISRRNPVSADNVNEPVAARNSSKQLQPAA